MRIATILLLVFASSTCFGQIRDVSVLAGVNVPIHKGMENDAVVAVNYGSFNHKGLGFRIGLQWSPSVADIDNSFGVPVAFSYRTGNRKLEERLESGVLGSIDAISQESPYSETGVKARNMAAGFLMSLFSDMEFFIGVTPGYVAGASSNPSKSVWGSSGQYWEETWTEKKNAFSISADAGLCLNYRIWRFDIKLIPAFHYYITSNYVQHKTSVEGDLSIRRSDTPLRWLFSFSGGIAYRFN